MTKEGVPGKVSGRIWQRNNVAARALRPAAQLQELRAWAPVVLLCGRVASFRDGIALIKGEQISYLSLGAAPERVQGGRR